MRRRAGLLGIVLFIIAILLILAAPFAYAEPVGCTTTYVSTASNPPADADPLICEGKLCTEGVGVDPSATGPFVDHEVTAADTYVRCVV